MIYKDSRFSKTLLKKSLKFILYEGVSFVLFNLNLILLPMEVDFFLKKQGCKKLAFIAFNISRLKMILVLATEIKTFYMQVFIV